MGSSNSGAGGAHGGQVQTDRGTKWEPGTPGQGGREQEHVFRSGQRKAGVLETAEREEELGLWQDLGEPGKEIKTHLQMNMDRNRGMEATLGFLPH